MAINHDQIRHAARLQHGQARNLKSQEHKRHWKTTWKVVPISEKQHLDVREEDLLANGDFRKCDTRRAGGGYDQFSAIAARRLGVTVHNQFVVQLYGCPLECFYCYVTPEGIWGKWKPYTTEELVEAFIRSGQEVFHLMGGAPALYLLYWSELIRALHTHHPPLQMVFHSDFLLVESLYARIDLQRISQRRCLYAVNIKGSSEADHQYNTGVRLKRRYFWTNLDSLVEVGVPFYITFTNPDPQHLAEFKRKIRDRYPGRDILADSFVIDLIPYKALEV